MNIWDIMKIVFWILIVSGTVFYFTKSVKRLFQVAGGLTVYELYNSLFDIGLWPIIQGWFGAYGALGLTVTALICNFIILKWYQKCQVDWLGITVVDDILEKIIKTKVKWQKGSILKKILFALPVLILWFAEKAITVRIIPFLALSAIDDSFVATAFYLHRKNGTVKTAMTKWDYGVFIVSTVFGCVVWSLFTEWVTLPAFRNVWQTFFN